MRALAVALVAGVLVGSAQPAAAADRYTPLVPSVMSKPRWFEDSRGAVVPPSSTAVVWFDVVLPRPAAVPRRIAHRVTVSVPPGYPVPERITVAGAGARVDRRPPVVLDAPLRARDG